MTTSSSIPVVKATIVELIVAAVTPVQASYAHPGETVKSESVYVGDVFGWTQEWGGIGQKARDERYSIDVTVDVFKPGKSQQAATERAFEILAWIEQSIVATPTLGLDPSVVNFREPIKFAPKGDVLEGLSADADGRACRVPFSISVSTRIG